MDYRKTLVNVKHFYRKWLKNILENTDTTLHILVVVGLRCVRFRLENEALQHDYGYFNFDKIFSDLGNHAL